MRTVDLSTVERHSPIVESAAVAAERGVWLSEDDTRAFAARLAGKPHIAQAFIALRGELGTGKTTFVRHLLRALGVSGRIKSPTYAVVEPHEVPWHGGSLSIWHFDFYRFHEPREWEDAGLRDLFAAPGLKLAEWPDKAAGLLPPADLSLTLDLRPDGSRDVRMDAASDLGRELLA